VRWVALNGQLLGSRRAACGQSRGVPVALMKQLPPQLRRTRPEEMPDGHAPTLAPPRSSSGNGASRAALPRRLMQPLPLIGIALLVIALIGYVAVAARARERTSEVVIAARGLPAGTRLTVSDLRLAKLSAGNGLLSELVPGSAETTLLGRRLAAPVIGGLPIGRADIAASGGGPAAFTLAVPLLHALGGILTVGDRVSVLATFTSSTGSSTAKVIARNLVVLAVGQPPVGIDESSATIPVTVALSDPSIASELALANSVGKIDLLRQGGVNTAPIPAATASGTGAS
jgi:pilus assembly protein CpaB